ncbi:MAG: flagellar export chaperone FliS [Thermoleophilia bacterium]|nr:flagellar export chaperone FliS [Thermoleophilia bacterium]
MSHIGHDAYRVNAVETASPEQLTLMCYDGALRFMRRAAKALEDGDLAGANNATGRAQAIINELNVTLDMERGGEIARNLRDLYLFVNRHMASGLATREAPLIRESIGLVRELREAWAESMNLGVAAA